MATSKQALKSHILPLSWLVDLKLWSFWQPDTTIDYGNSILTQFWFWISSTNDIWNTQRLTKCPWFLVVCWGLFTICTWRQKSLDKSHKNPYLKRSAFQGWSLETVPTDNQQVSHRWAQIGSSVFHRVLDIASRSDTSWNTKLPLMTFCVLAILNVENWMLGTRREEEMYTKGKWSNANMTQSNWETAIILFHGELGMIRLVSWLFNQDSRADVFFFNTLCTGWQNFWSFTFISLKNLTSFQKSIGCWAILVHKDLLKNWNMALSPTCKQNSGIMVIFFKIETNQPKQRLRRLNCPISHALMKYGYVSHCSSLWQKLQTNWTDHSTLLPLLCQQVDLEAALGWQTLYVVCKEHLPDPNRISSWAKPVTHPNTLGSEPAWNVCPDYAEWTCPLLFCLTYVQLAQTHSSFQIWYVEDSLSYEYSYFCLHLESKNSMQTKLVWLDPSWMWCEQHQSSCPSEL